MVMAPDRFQYLIIEILVTPSTTIVTRTELVQIAGLAAYDLPLHYSRAIHGCKIGQYMIIVKEYYRLTEITVIITLFMG